MNSPTTMVTVREAATKDNRDLLALTRSTPMEGVIRLRIDREPDFFRLLNMRGQGKVFVAIVDQSVVGCISVAYRCVFVHGRAQRIGYIGDLKVHPSFAGSRVVLRLMQTLFDYTLRQDVDLYFCVIASGNERTFSLLQGRFGIPKFEPVGKFVVYEILPSPIRTSKKFYEIAEADEDDIDEVCALVNEYNKSYQFAPLVTEGELHSFTDSAASESPMRMFIARNDGMIRATVCSFDADHVKKNVVISMPVILRLAVNALQFSNKIVPFFAVPTIGKAVRMFYLRNVAFQHGYQDALRMLLQTVRNEAFHQKYSFVAIGIHERDPLKFLVRGLLRFTFVSHGFAASLRNDRDSLAKIVSGIPMEDYALV